VQTVDKEVWGERDKSTKSRHPGKEGIIPFTDGCNLSQFYRELRISLKRFTSGHFIIRYPRPITLGAAFKSWCHDFKTVLMQLQLDAGIPRFSQHHYTPWSKVIFEKLVKKLHYLYGTQIFITAFTTDTENDLQPLESCLQLSTLFMIHFNITLPSTPWSPMPSLLSKFSD
jgi:hypothetical protein